MTKIGFIGLGNMGGPMAVNLAKAGYHLNVYDLVPEKMEPLVKMGATAKEHPAAVAAASDVVITMVLNSAHLEHAALGSNGVIEGIAAGKIYIDCSTIAPTMTRKVHAAMAERGVRMIDAPVANGVAGARAGTLAIMVGGDRAVFEEVLPILNAMGKQIIHAGDIGAGEVVKIANALVVAASVICFSEVLPLGVKWGVKTDTLIQVMAASSGDSFTLRNHIAKHAAVHKFPDIFPIENLMKDITLGLEMASDVNMPMPMAGLVDQLYRTGKSIGLGGHGYFTQIIKMFEQWAGVEVMSESGEDAVPIDPRPSGGVAVPPARR